MQLTTANTASTAKKRTYTKLFNHPLGEAKKKLKNHVSRRVRRARRGENYGF
jgi:hypothetical protein